MAYLGRVNEDHFHPGNTLDTFTGDGTTVTYTLSKSVPGGAESQLTVVVNNVIQDPSSAYSVGGSNNDQLTFSGAPNSGALIYVIHQGFFTTTMTPAGESVGAEHLQPNLRNFRLDSFVGTGAISSFTLSDTPASPNSVIVFVGGVYQTPLSNYAVVGNTLSFDESPLLNETITVLHLGFQTSSRVVPDGSITAEKLSSTVKTFNVDSFIGDGVTVTYTLSEAPVTENSILVSVNGLVQRASDHYSIAGTSLTFSTAPVNAANIRVLHLGFKSGQIGVLDGSVTTPKLTSESVTTPKLASESVTTPKLASESVTTPKLASGSVDLTTKVSNILPVSNGGTGASDVTGARSNLNVYSKTEIDTSKSFPSGTRIPFQQTTAPTGWTKDTTAAINDSILRLVTGSVGSGGSLAFSSWSAQTSVGATTLSVAQIPAHTHDVGVISGTTIGGGISANSGTGTAKTTTFTSTSTGGGGSHTHTVSQSIKYYDFIIAQKN